VSGWRDPRRLAAVAVGVGGVGTLGLATWLGLGMGEAPAAQRIGAALVPALVGSAALWLARRLWRAAQRTST
jgi:hypothetical protein